MGGQGGQLPIQVLADHVTLSQLEEADFVPRITAFPPRFRYLPTPLLEEDEHTLSGQ
jgi:hypothetical protein